MIASEKEPNPATPFYSIYVGISARDKTLFLQLETLVKEHGYYLSLYSIEVREFVEKLAWSMHIHSAKLNWQSYKITDFMREYKQQKCLPQSKFITPARSQLLTMVDNGDIPEQNPFQPKKQRLPNVIQSVNGLNVEKPKLRFSSLN